MLNFLSCLLSIYFEVPFCDLVTIAVGLLEKVLDGSGGWGVTRE